MPQAQAKTLELLGPIEDSIKKLKDKEQIKLIKQYAELISNLNEVKAFVEEISDKYIPEDERGQLEAVIQDVEAKMLDTNGDLLEFLEMVTERETLGKSDLGSYFLDTMKAIIKELGVVDSVLDKWKVTIEREPSTIKDKMLQKSLVWLRSRTSGPLIRVATKNSNLSKLLDKMRREKVTTEVRKILGI